MKNVLPGINKISKARIAAVAGTALLAGALLAGCNNSQNNNQASDTTSNDTQTQVEPVSTGNNTDAADSQQQTAQAEAFNFSKGLTEDGYWEGITALDYVTLPVYRGLQMPASQVVPTEAAIQQQIDAVLANHQERTTVTDRAVADGDTLNIDYVGKIDGVAFEGGSTQGNGTTVTIGTTRYIDDFLEQLIGHMPGETFDIEVTFPEDYGKEELNGKDAVFTVTINFITETKTPELSDEWVAANLSDSYGWNSVQEMRDEITHSLQDQLTTYFIQDYLAYDTEVTQVPEVMTEYQKNYLIDYYRSYAAQYGMTLENALPMLAGVDSVDALVESQQDGIRDAAKISLVFQAIAENEGIKVTQEDVLSFFENMGITDISQYEEQYGTPYLRLRALESMVMDIIEKNAVIVDDSAASESVSADNTSEQTAESTKQSDSAQPADSEKKASDSEQTDKSETAADSDQTSEPTKDAEPEKATDPDKAAASEQTAGSEKAVESGAKSASNNSENASAASEAVSNETSDAESQTKDSGSSSK